MMEIWLGKALFQGNRAGIISQVRYASTNILLNWAIPVIGIYTREIYRQRWRNIWPSISVRGTIDWNYPPSPGTIIATCVSSLKQEVLVSNVELLITRYWNGAGPYGPCPPTMSSACLLPVEKFSQIISLIREMRNAETKENSLRRLSNNNVVIKHRQGPLALSQVPNR